MFVYHMKNNKIVNILKEYRIYNKVFYLKIIRNKWIILKNLKKHSVIIREKYQMK